jgi:aspartokinase-like uncharacterized kinase
MIVVKVGGSLFDTPGLGPGLRAWLRQFDGSPVTLVAGGGHSAEAVRTYDRIHSLGEETAHRLAVKSLAVTSNLLRTLVGDVPGVTVLDAVSFCEADEVLPHSWAVTTDSIAARASAVLGATKFVLLKSLDLPTGLSWADAARNGFVDDYFPVAVERLSCPIEVINFRTILSGS